jgi:hypothetical protein
MSLVYKAAQVVATTNRVENKPWSMKGDDGKDISGVSNYVDVTVISTDGGVGVIRLKGKDQAEVNAKLAKLTIGKPAEIAIKGMEDSTRGVLILNA